VVKLINANPATNHSSSVMRNIAATHFVGPVKAQKLIIVQAVSVT